MKRSAYAVFSCDLDTVDRHLQGYGIDGLEACDAVYRHAVPRLFALLEELDAPCVLFTIARDAEPQRELLARAAEAGHEVASHSLTHPQPFRTLPEHRLREEIETSRDRLSRACGREVVGFRAPAWDVDDRVVAELVRAGYRYDASIFPTPVLIASRLSAFRRSEAMGSIFSMDLLGHAFARRTPHRLTGVGRGLVEFPVAVTRWLRFPTYHTLAYFTPRKLYKRALQSLLRRDEPICYEFHAADLLALDDEGVDPRMDRHPGMKLPLDEKLELLRSVLREIVSARRPTTYEAVVRDVFDA